MSMEQPVPDPGLQFDSAVDVGLGVAYLADDEFRRMSGSKRAWLEFRRNRFALVGAAFMIFITFMGVFAPIVATHDPYAQSLRKRMKPPSAEHWLGTDEVGRDFYSRLVYGARVSLFVGIVGTAAGVTLGTIVGLISGFFGGWTDTLIMRVIDIMYSFPGIVLAIVMVAALGPSLFNLILVLVFFAIPTLARIVRGNILSLKELDYAEAARAMGAGRLRIMFHHLLPNTLAPIIVYATLAVAGSILVTASLGFLGLGVQPPQAEWGNILSNGRQYLRKAPMLMVYPGALIFLTVMSINLIGDALRDALDPYLQS
ncbi:MAG: ABC transporter permease [Chloroflexota bacterium]|nr:ABC transporter permease [Chloroflexota bacterium]MDE2947818.1 ABC transporter permease [Chloroflexota bacterium]